MKYPDRISPSFVRAFRDIEPPWGPVGYITYKRTYSRRIDENKTEEWYQTVERCCNGLLEIGGAFTQEQIQTLYSYVFDLKCCFSGRALWQLGTDTVRRLGGDSLQNCFAAETEVLTRDGIFKIGDLENREVAVLTRNGCGPYWTPVQFRCYGEQELYEVVFSDGTRVRATGEHEWVVGGKRVMTMHLQGQYVTTNFLPPDTPGRRLAMDNVLEKVRDSNTINYSEEIHRDAQYAGLACVIQGDYLKIDIRPERPVVSRRVMIVRPLSVKEKVYCCVVPGTHCFTLANGVLTGNCWNVTVNSLDAFTFTFNELMLGGGVGFNITPEYVYELPPVKHSVRVERVTSFDCGFVVPDNREGWVELLNQTFQAFFYTGKDLYYNTFGIRDKGTLIRGFGGIASGAEELVRGIGLIAQILRGAHGRKLKPVECLDIMNIVGMVTVAGNVRRCLPGKAAVNTGDGIKRIDKIRVGDRVQTLAGYKKVVNVFDQGVQKLVTVGLSNKQTIDCTPTHRFAVLTSGNGEIEWFQAGHLVEGDTLLYNHQPCKGRLSDWRQMYFYGVFAGDGSVCVREAAAVVVACSSSDELTDRICEYVSRFGLTSKIRENGHHVVIESSDFARMLLPYKIPTVIPEFVWSADAAGRAAYLAGLCDADGTPSKFNLCSSKYPELLAQVQILAASLGIMTRIDRRPYANEHMLIIVGYESKQLACDLFNEFAVRKLPRIEVPKNDCGISRDMAPEGYTLGPNEMRVIHKSLKEFMPDFWSKVMPVQVAFVDDYGDEEHTYDIEVEGEHCFFADGVLVHNSAEIGVGSPHDREFLEAKNWSKRSIPAWRQHSNNSVIAESIQDLPPEFWEPYDGHGEPYGLINLPLIRKMGRLEDGMNYRPDPRVSGVNPCVTGDTWVATSEGPRQVFQLIGKPFEAMVDGKPYQSTSDGFFSQGVKPVFRVETDEGHSFQATGDHRVQPWDAKHWFTVKWLWLGARLKYGDSFATVRDVIPIGEQEVFDCTIPDIHRYVGNGFTHHNCGEANLESYEACNLAEIFLPNLEDINEFVLAAELMLMVTKTISTLTYIHPSTNEVVQRNHRLGVGVTGFCASKLNAPGVFNAVYLAMEECDRDYSKLMGVRESIKLSVVKPSGTVSLLPGVPPGVHPEYSPYYLRRITFAANNPLVDVARSYGYHIEPKINIDGSLDYNSMIVAFPVKARNGAVTEKSLTAIDQLENQLFLQRYWADQSVSMTCYYKPEELTEIKDWLSVYYTDSVKTASFLRHSGHGFKQAPYEEISREQYESLKRKPINNVEFDSDDTPIDECVGGACPIR